MACNCKKNISKPIKTVVKKVETTKTSDKNNNGSGKIIRRNLRW